MDADRRRQRAITTATVADTYETDRNAEQLRLGCETGMRTHRLCYNLRLHRCIIEH